MKEIKMIRDQQYGCPFSKCVLTSMKKMLASKTTHSVIDEFMAIQNLSLRKFLLQSRQYEL